MTDEPMIEELELLEAAARSNHVSYAGFTRMFLEAVPGILSELKAAREALRRIAVMGCQSGESKYLPGKYRWTWCPEIRGPEWTDWCNPCIARAALASPDKETT